MDYYSKFPEISLLSSSSVVVNSKSIFARHGVPDKLVADNMPFASRELQHFALSWGFQLITSSPGYPQSNGDIDEPKMDSLQKCTCSPVSPSFRSHPTSTDSNAKKFPSERV